MTYEQWKFSSHSSGDWESDTRLPASMAEFWWGLCSGLPVAVFSSCGREASQLSRASLIRALTSFTRAPPHDLITSQRPHLLTPSPGGLGFQHMDTGETHQPPASREASVGEGAGSGETLQQTWSMRLHSDLFSRLDNRSGF